MLDDIQTVIVIGSPDGTFQLTLDDLTTDPIPCGSTPAAMQAAIGGKCTVTYATVTAYLVITEAGDKFFKLYPKNNFGSPIDHTHQYLPEYTTSMRNQPESAIVVEHTVEGDDDTNDIQTLVTTNTTGLFTLVVKHEDDKLDSTNVIQRNVPAATIEAALNNLPPVYDNYDVTVVANTAVAYRVVFPNIVGLPRMLAVPDFTGGLYPGIITIHSGVGGPLLPSCCKMPSVTPADPVPRIVIQRLTR